ncbi:MAG: creatinine amidohydrolase [Planctomycetota bacterium]|jgi:creatinine amidohydrolase
MNEIRYEGMDELELLFKPQTIALLPVGSTSPHGPHLPLDTDVIVAEELARSAATLIEEQGVGAMVLPALPYGITRIAQGFAGGVTLRPGTLWAIVEDLALSLAQDGVQQLVVCNAHYEFEHQRMLSNLAIDFCKRGPGHCQVLFPRELTSGETAAFAESECHAGSRETSLMLAIAPERVRMEALEGLQAVAVELPKEIPGVNRSLLDLGANQAYLGDPGAASAEQGQRILSDLACALALACRGAWPDLFESNS